MTDIWFVTLISLGTTMTTVLPTGISLAIVLLIVNYVSVYVRIVCLVTELLRKEMLRGVKNCLICEVK